MRQGTKISLFLSSALFSIYNFPEIHFEHKNDFGKLSQLVIFMLKGIKISEF